ncbi:phage tail protein [Acinetobacter dispersus]|uniref:phage tail fiber protein n=1 Tax=Acinetobacter dispersus TaxID=70348 RepID=UPI001F4A6D97|nr:phage tail protein [Acinetobacter dispersus]MCH7394183.1 phage tail protein [Acinetobacter dispersus]
MANLIFKFNWEHRPYPYNAAQGKQQFMLPFASGIPNLTPDWTQVVGAGTAATGTLTTSREDANVGRVLKVGDYGIGDNSPTVIATPPLSVGGGTILCRRTTGDNSAAHGLPSGTFAVSTFSTSPANAFAIFYPMNVRHDIYVGNLTLNSGSDSVQRFFKMLSAANTTVDGNGFIKAASPIVKLYANSIELNEDAKEQPITFERLGTGDYLLKGSLGLAQEGWYIEIPKDANGNTVVAVLYETLENGDISIKTYKRKFDFEIAAVVADLDNPLDIPAGRWIDIRLHEEPKTFTELDEPVSKSPADFQPINLAQAVAAAMSGVELPEITDGSSNESL